MSAAEARCSLAQRFAGRADRLRQLATRLGARSRRVFLVWTESTGEETSTGEELVRFRRELLPTPRVADATSLIRRPLSIGIVPDGSIRVDQISVAWYTEDHLRGLRVPEEYGQQAQSKFHPGTPKAEDRSAPVLRAPLSFFYEIVEDGRGDEPAARTRYQLGAAPWRNETGVHWAVMLVPQSSPTDRNGKATLDAFDVNDD